VKRSRRFTKFICVFHAPNQCQICGPHDCDLRTDDWQNVILQVPSNRRYISTRLHHVTSRPIHFSWKTESEKVAHPHDTRLEIRRSHTSVDEDSERVECDAVSQSEWLLTFRRNVRSHSPPCNTASYPRISESMSNVARLEVLATAFVNDKIFALRGNYAVLIGGYRRFGANFRFYLQGSTSPRLLF